jgi:hypothetical protein
MIRSLPQSLIDAAEQILSESFDKPLTTVPVPEDSMLHQMGTFSAAMIGGSNFKMASIPDNGFILQFDKDGATELHHVDENLTGGYKKDIPTKSAIRFASTFANHAKNIINSGTPVRIVAHENLADNFRRITDRLLAKNPEYTASNTKDDVHPITGDKLKSWEIYKSK